MKKVINLIIDFMKINYSNRNIMLTLVVFFIITFQSYAQTAIAKGSVDPETKPIEIPEFLFNPSFYILFITGLIVLAAIGALCYSIIKLSNQLSGEKEKVKEVEVAPLKIKRVTSWHKLMHKLTRSV